MKGNAAFAIPFSTSDLSTTKTTSAVDTNTQRTKAHCRLNGPFHRTAETDPALKLLCNVLGNQFGVDLRLANLNDVQTYLATDAA